MNKKLALSLLDFGSFYPPTFYAHDVINHLIVNIYEYEKMGYSRYWLSEHYGKNIAWNCPEHLLPLLAGYSRKLKVGAAGVLMKYHNPLRVAQAYKILSALYPDRIDLGIARGEIDDVYKKAFAISEEKLNNKYFITQVDLLHDFLLNTHTENHMFNQIQIQPIISKPPSIWFLGSSINSIQLAVKHGGAFCLSLIHSKQNAKEMVNILKSFKELYFEKYNILPECSIALQCFCSNSLITLKKFTSTNSEKNWWNGVNSVLGDSKGIKDQLLYFKDLFDVSEIVVLNYYTTLEEKQESISSVANEFFK
ncbi:LLM class flavin-dependent oxidoreductase [Pedobacter cryoconitis]|uniref:Luciferase family oxidoreductase group 1 n=1 Tax=Pedobacter cryoconitis TaxID=188932 RepID=A0A7X0MKY0_9SPHI|nr:LLM class flavin-dependent oxidoreductase [Pedobacter cryoconitis]MBB6503027.1 luciferase family oxidoreductase group 1 [Pedobacter cryoconitis]